MNVTYKSEIGRGMLLILLIATTYMPMIMLLIVPELWATAVFTVGLSVILFWLSYQNTFYRISYDGELRIKAPFFSQTIRTAHIRCIRPHRSYRSYLYALSEKKLIIYYGHQEYVEISPQHRKAFVADLLILNPAIEVRTEETHR